MQASRRLDGMPIVTHKSRICFSCVEDKADHTAYTIDYIMLWIGVYHGEIDMMYWAW